MKTTETSVIVEGTLKNIIFSSDETHFTVAKMDCSQGSIIVVGNIFSANEGEHLRVSGHWKNHAKYGKQLQIESFEVILPTQKEMIEKYLASGIISCIGPSLAKRIVERFGEKTFEVLDNEFDRITEISGIGKKKAKKIEESWSEKREVREAMLFLASYGIAGGRAAKIYNKYKGNLVSILKHTPYRLAIDIDGIGFLTADKIARKVGIPENDPERIKAAIIHVLNEASSQGHCYLPKQELVMEVKRLIGLEDNLIEEIIQQSNGDKILLCDSDEDVLVYLSRLLFREQQVAKYLKGIIDTPFLKPIRSPEKSILSTEKRMDIKFQGGQQEALIKTLRSKISVITGGPGVGKTTIVKALVTILLENKYEVALAAPTGRAAKRLSEATNASASTIHRLLKFNPHERKFEFNQHNKLPIDWLIIDESSMIDISLAYHLLVAIPEDAGVTFVGDCDQLPSVGPGNFLADIISSKQVPISSLTQIFRQSSDSSIIFAAHQINSGKCPKIINSDQSDIFFIYEKDCEKGAELITDLVARRIPEKYCLDPLTEIQTLTPMYRGAVGANNLNTILSQTLNPQRQQSGAGKFCDGDKVMQISNNYEKDVYNGDVGIIKHVNRIDQNITINFDHRNVLYDFNELDQIVLAYAISIHKSQGSEYPAVIIPLFTQHFIMLERNLLYTAITRGKKLVILVGSWEAMSIAVNNMRAKNRYTRLAKLI